MQDSRPRYLPDGVGKDIAIKLLTVAVVVQTLIAGAGAGTGALA